MNSKTRGLKPAVDISDKLNGKITWMGKTSSSTVSTEVKHFVTIGRRVNSIERVLALSSI